MVLSKSWKESVGQVCFSQNLISRSLTGSQNPNCLGTEPEVSSKNNQNDLDFVKCQNFITSFQLTNENSVLGHAAETILVFKIFEK